MVRVTEGCEVDPAPARKPTRWLGLYCSGSPSGAHSANIFPHFEDRYLIPERQVLHRTRQRQAPCLELVLIHDPPSRQLSQVEIAAKAS